MGEFSLTHWIVVLVILLIFFGPSKLPHLGQSLGKAIRGFKEGLKEVQEDDSQKPSVGQIPQSENSKAQAKTEDKEKTKI